MQAYALRTQMTSWLTLFAQTGSHAGIRKSTWRTGSAEYKKSAAPKNGALPRITTGANQIRPES